MVSIADVLARAQQIPDEEIDPIGGMTMDDVQSAMMSQEPETRQQYAEPMMQQPDQYDRITQLLQQAQQQPQGEPLSGLDIFKNYAATVGTGKDYRTVADAEIARRTTAQDRQVQSGKDLLAVAEQKAASGDRAFGRMLERVKLFTGDDPEGQAQAMEYLESLPYDVDPSNAAQVLSELGKWSQKSGYKSYDLQYQKQKKQLELQQMQAQADLYNAKALGGGGTGSGGSTKFERNKNRLIELAGRSDLNPLEKQELEILKLAVDTEARGGMDPYQRKLGMETGADMANVQDTYNNTEMNLVAIDQALAASSDPKMQGPLKQGYFAQMLPNMSEESQVIDAQGLQQALSYVQQTKGAISNAEMGLFINASVGTGRNPERNQSLLQAAKAALVRNKQKFEFINAYTNMGGTPQEAITAFAKFAQANPIIKAKGAGIELLKPIEQIQNDRSWEAYLPQEDRTFGAENPVNGGSMDYKSKYGLE